MECGSSVWHQPTTLSTPIAYATEQMPNYMDELPPLSDRRNMTKDFSSPATEMMEYLPLSGQQPSQSKSEAVSRMSLAVLLQPSATEQPESLPVATWTPGATEVAHIGPDQVFNKKPPIQSNTYDMVAFSVNPGPIDLNPHNPEDYSEDRTRGRGFGTLQVGRGTGKRGKFKTEALRKSTAETRLIVSCMHCHKRRVRVSPSSK